LKALKTGTEFGTIQYYEELIDNEKSDRKAGYLDRIASYQAQIKKFKLLIKVQEGIKIDEAAEMNQK
jgi:hypothetical protein